MNMTFAAHSINSEKNFISGWYLEDIGLCDELIQFFKDSPDREPGLTTGYLGKGNIDHNAKDSSDLNLPRGELASRYIKQLNDIAREYLEEYEYAGKLVPWGVVEPIAIQHYQPGGGFKIWHFERDNTNEEIARRHLAFMTYLNDVNDGGGTAFYYQDVTIKAEKGLTLIWPVEWTHTHKGIVSPSQEKYIITGWFSTFTQEQFAHFSNHS